MTLSALPGRLAAQIGMPYEGALVGLAAANLGRGDVAAEQFLGLADVGAAVKHGGASGGPQRVGRADASLAGSAVGQLLLLHGSGQLGQVVGDRVVHGSGREAALGELGVAAAAPRNWRPSGARVQLAPPPGPRLGPAFPAGRLARATGRPVARRRGRLHPRSGAAGRGNDLASLPDVRRHKDGTATLTFQVDGLEEILWWVLGRSGRVRVANPPELRDPVLTSSSSGSASTRPDFLRGFRGR
jgi:hypothetical protein